MSAYQVNNPGDVHLYCTGQSRASLTTLFGERNDDASSFLEKLPFDGILEYNMFFGDYAAVVNMNGVKIAGLNVVYLENRDHQRTLSELNNTDELHIVSAR